MIDLATGYLGLPLRTPLIASASPLCKDLPGLERLEQAGAAAVVLPSLFEEQIAAEEEFLDRYLCQGTDSFAEAQSYFPDLQAYGIGPKTYLQLVEKAKKTLRIPVIASLNGVSTGGWVNYARQIESAGADALELNVYFLATDPDVEGCEIEEAYLDLVSDIKVQLTIPVAVKLAPYFTSMANMASRLDQAGADALVLFNRFYQPDFDLETLEVTPNLQLSTPDELRLRLHWAAVLGSRLRAQLAITGGVHTGEDAVKCIMAGAQVVMLTSALLKNGVPYLKEVETQLLDWMRDHDYESIRQMRGAMNIEHVAHPGAFERANYLKVLHSYSGK